MTDQNVAAPSTNDLGPFLYSDLGVERTGMELTLLSALARQGLDPWKEAARLASLPRTAATADLSAKLARVGLPNGADLAARLTGLLPGPATTARRTAKPTTVSSTGWLMAAMVAGALSGFFFTPQKPADTVAPASWFSESAPAAKDAGQAKPAPVKEASKEPGAAPTHPENG